MSDSAAYIVERPWMILLASSPEQAENRLLRENVGNGNRYFSDLFVPYMVMGTEGSGRESDEGGLSLRSALRRYLFIRVNEPHFQELVEALNTWNQLCEDKLFFLTFRSENDDKTVGRVYARIKDSEKQLIEKACLEHQKLPYLSLSMEDLEVGRTLSLAGTPFESLAQTCEVVEVTPRKSSGSVDVRIQVTMFGTVFDNLHITFKDADNYGDNATLIASSQKQLLDIFCRRVNKKGIEAYEDRDEAILQSVFGHRNKVFPAGAMKRHFLALMLICAHLLGDEKGVQRFAGSVSQELKAISALRESKAATDTRAYLHIALFIATGDSKYRTLAKTYVSKYNPSSPYLRKFVTTMSKFSATKVVGPAGRVRE